MYNSITETVKPYESYNSTHFSSTTLTALVSQNSHVSVLRSECENYKNSQGRGLTVIAATAKWWRSILRIYAMMPTWPRPRSWTGSRSWQRARFVAAYLHSQSQDSKTQCILVISTFLKLQCQVTANLGRNSEIWLRQAVDLVPYYHDRPSISSCAADWQRR